MYGIKQLCCFLKKECVFGLYEKAKIGIKPIEEAARQANSRQYIFPRNMGSQCFDMR